MCPIFQLRDGRNHLLSMGYPGRTPLFVRFRCVAAVGGTAVAGHTYHTLPPTRRTLCKHACAFSGPLCYRHFRVVGGVAHRLVCSVWARRTLVPVTKQNLIAGAFPCPVIAAEVHETQLEKHVVRPRQHVHHLERSVLVVCSFQQIARHLDSAAAEDGRSAHRVRAGFVGEDGLDRMADGENVGFGPHCQVH